jgi:hypothetical protein
MFRSLALEGYPTILCFHKTPTKPIKFEDHMKIGIIPYHSKITQILPHITEEHINAIVERIHHQLIECEHDAEVIDVRNFQLVKDEKMGVEGLEYVGAPKYNLIVKCDWVTGKDYLDNYLWVHAYGGPKYESIVAAKSSYAFGKDAHLDTIWTLTADALHEAATNCLNISFHLQGNKAAPL